MPTFFLSYLPQTNYVVVPCSPVAPVLFPFGFVFLEALLPLPGCWWPVLEAMGAMQVFYNLRADS